MSWFSWRRGKPREPDPDEQAQQASEFVDQYHRRASLRDGDRMIIQPGKVLDNITEAMERVDLDINTEVSIEEDVVAVDELMSLIQNLRLGPTLAAHVVNTAMRIMSARYPAALVRTPLPPEYDLRKILALNITDQQHNIAKTIFNQRTTSATDLTEEDIAGQLESLTVPDQMELFVTLFYMYGTKVGAMKHRTDIA
ncbi:MAG TPA: hypothetical protein VFN75_03275 [Pseudonocardiaceae bacterium]|nr:hypothetical protein [Pseudonocardiaceae bacterium]